MQQMLSPLPPALAGQQVSPSAQHSPLQGVNSWAQHCDPRSGSVLLVHDCPGWQQN
jgi:hypothetical protein